MFTQCANCETVFELSAEVLRAAGGQVRCGRCGEVFNALARLSEDAEAFPVGESPLEMETLADHILESPPPSTPPTTPEADTNGPFAPDGSDELAQADVEFARLQVLESSMDNLLEFTLPPGELDRVFVEPKPGKPSSPAAQPPTTLDFELEPEPEPELKLKDAHRPTPAPTLAPAAAPASRISAAQERFAPAATPTDEAAPRKDSGQEVPDEVWRDVLAGFEEAALPQIGAPRRGELPRAVWIAAAVSLAAALIAQIALTHRDVIPWHFSFAGPTAANLSVYQLRQWGVTGDPTARGTLRVRASILNTAAQAEPYPLLRLSLANRFGNRIGTRDFEPAEYLGKSAARMLASGERVDATLDILDPGKDAEGFEIDVCLRGADRKISCAADAAMQGKQ